MAAKNGKSFRYLGRYLGRRLWLVPLFLAGAFGRSAEALRYFPVTKSVAPGPSAPRTGQWTLGFAAHSLIPSSGPFSEDVAGVSGPFNFQISSQLSLDLSYAINPVLELGVAVGFSRYDSNFNRELSGQLTQIDTASLHSLPSVTLLARAYKPVSDRIDLESELGLGLDFNSLKVSTSVANVDDQIVDFKSFRSHIAMGFAMDWAYDLSTHFLIGYQYQTLKTLLLPSVAYDIAVASHMAGFFAKANIRFLF